MGNCFGFSKKLEKKEHFFIWKTIQKRARRKRRRGKKRGKKRVVGNCFLTCFHLRCIEAMALKLPMIKIVKKKMKILNFK